MLTAALMGIDEHKTMEVVRKALVVTRRRCLQLVPPRDEALPEEDPRKGATPRPRLGRHDYPDLNVLTSPPGGGFGPPVALAPNVDHINNLRIAPGHAVLTFNSVVTSEPVN